MMPDKEFNALVDLAMQTPGLSAMRPVVEKEILHYDIFHALDRAGMLKHLVFQGGTALRLCRGSNRFSEDLDFAGGKDFDAEAMRALKDCVETHIGKRYGLNVTVKEPKPGEPAGVDNITVDRWLVTVETTPENRAMPRQKIKLEVANIPAYTSELVPLQVNYDFLAGMSDVLVYTESMSEIVADKVLAFPTSVTSPAGEPNPLSSKRLRHRDIWDLAWLSKRRAALDPAMVLKKAGDYGVANYHELLDNAILALPMIVHSKEFSDQMRRFIDADTVTRTLDVPAYLDYLAADVGGTLADMQRFMVAPAPSSSIPSTPTRARPR